MSSIDATFYAAQGLFYAIQNPASENPLGKLGNGHKKALRTLVEKIIKAIPPAVPLRVPVREVVQDKPQEVNQEKSNLKNQPKENHPLINNLWGCLI